MNHHTITNTVYTCTLKLEQNLQYQFFNYFGEVSNLWTYLKIYTTKKFIFKNLTLPLI